MPTTHFRNGVSNQIPGNPLFEYPYLDPFKYYSYVNDFFTYHADEWTITTTEGGSGNASEALTSQAGGALLITNDDADDDNDFFNLKGESFKYVAGKNMFFKAKFKVSDATQSDFVMGLHITDTSPLDVTDGIFFISADGDAGLDFQVEKDNTATTTEDVATMADDTFITVSWFIDANRDAVYYSINNAAPLKSAATNLPDDEELTISFGIQNGEASAQTMTVDYVTCMIER